MTKDNDQISGSGFFELNYQKELDADIKDSVYIGDSEIDLLTAENVGIDSIAVTWGFRNRKFLEEHGATLIAETAEEIKNLILS